MAIGRRGRHPGGEPASRAFDPWAPRSPLGSTAKRTAPPPPQTSTHVRPPTMDLRTSGHPYEATAPGATGSPHHPGTSLPGRAPVTDDRRPAGAPPAPPTTWPTPRLPAELAPSTHAPRSGRALWAFVAFLLGALVVGSAFAAYALGDRGEEAAAGGGGGGATTTAPLRAEGALDIQQILDIAKPSVVTIETGSAGSVFGGAGSGVVISEDGLILTNAHVIEGAGGTISVRFSDGSSASAELVGASTGDDIALIKADKDGLTAARLGSSANLLVGDPVVAIGNALNLGEDPSVTSGIVSAKDRSISDGTISLDHLIQTDAAINPGNSGGPLVNANGEVVGINTAIIAGAQNIGFSIAIDSVKELIQELQAGGGDLDANTAVLGVSTLDVASAGLDQATRDEFGITATSGAVVVEVDPQGGAGRAGIAVGDVVVGFEDQAITTAAELTRLVRAQAPGDEVSVEVERRGERTTFTVTLGP